MLRLSCVIEKVRARLACVRVTSTSMRTHSDRGPAHPSNIGNIRECHSPEKVYKGELVMGHNYQRTL